MDSEDKRLREQRRFVSSRPFPTCLRQPLLFRLAGKDRGEKGRLDAFGAYCGCYSGRNLILSCCEHTHSPYERFDTRRLSRNNWTCESVPLNGCGQSALHSKLQGSTDSPEFRWDRCLFEKCTKFRAVSNFAGKIQENQSGFLGRFKGAPGGNRNPPGLVFFLQLFLLEKQKKKLYRSR